jgi:hypothetical protein
MASQKRAILYMAFGYSGAWLLVWIPYFVLVVEHIMASGEDSYSPSKRSVLFSSAMTPLQGFFNFLVFMAPKVRHIRNTGMRRKINKIRLSWCHAFYKAYMARDVSSGGGGRVVRTSHRSSNKSSKGSSIKRMNDMFRSTLCRMTSRLSSKRNLFSGENIETNDSSERARSTTPPQSKSNSTPGTDNTDLCRIPTGDSKDRNYNDVEENGSSKSNPSSDENIGTEVFPDSGPAGESKDDNAPNMRWSVRASRTRPEKVSFLSREPEKISFLAREGGL